MATDIPTPHPGDVMDRALFSLYSSAIRNLNYFTNSAFRTFTEIVISLNAVMLLSLFLYFHVTYVTLAQESCFTAIVHKVCSFSRVDAYTLQSLCILLSLKVLACLGGCFT
jgi:hypothetical protein